MAKDTNNTSSKICTLQNANEDFEFYPTTPEIMEAMKKDLWAYMKSHERDSFAKRRSRDDTDIWIREDYEYDKGKRQ